MRKFLAYIRPINGGPKQGVLFEDLDLNGELAGVLVEALDGSTFYYEADEVEYVGPVFSGSIFFDIQESPKHPDFWDAPLEEEQKE